MSRRIRVAMGMSAARMSDWPAPSPLLRPGRHRLRRWGDHPGPALRLIHRQGRAVTVAVIVWGLAVVGFGLTLDFPVTLAMLVAAGWAT